MPDSPLASPLNSSAGPLGPPNAAAQQPQAPPAASPDLTNYNAANTAMKMNPQEQALYQMHLQNLHGSGGVDNPDGSRSTLYQITVQFGDKTMVLPTVWGGKILPPDQAIQMAKQYGLDKFPSYGSDQEAQARYDQMHNYMEQDTAAYLKSRGK
jgi:hypothetical protein